MLAMLLLLLMLLQLLPLCIADLPPRRTVKGAGATFPNEVYQSWIVAYEASRRDHVRADISYEAVGSGSGKARITSKAVDFAGSDSWLSEHEMQNNPDLRPFPTMAGVVTLTYNIPGLGNHTLILSMEVIVGIYNGTYGWWDEDVLQELNEQVKMPHQRIVVIARADKSGTTGIFTSSLSHASSAWESTYGTFSQGTEAEDPPWGSGVITYFGHQNRGMSGLLLSFEYSIGYLAIPDAEVSDLPYANMMTPTGLLVTPSVSTTQSLMDASLKATSGNLVVHLTDYSTADSYPIADYTYFIVRMAAMEDCETAIELLRFVHWFLHDPSASLACQSRNMVPVADSVAALIMEQVVTKLTCRGQLVWPLALEEMAAEARVKDAEKTYLPYVTTTCSLVAGVVIVVLGYFVYRYIQHQRTLMRDEWRIAIEDVTFYHTHVSSTSGTRVFRAPWPSVRSLTEIEDLDSGYQMLEHILQWPGKWGGLTVGLRLLEVKSPRNFNQDAKRLFLWMKDKVSHSNVLKFHGLTQVETNHYVVSDYCSRGPLYDVLRDDKYNLNKDFKMSISMDIATGLAYLHSKGIAHGNLRSSCFLVDFKWMTKIADWEYVTIYQRTMKKNPPMLLMRKPEEELDKEGLAFLDFWVAPEILKSEFGQVPCFRSDVYSYGIVLHEVFTRKDPYEEHAETSLPSDLLKNIMNNNLRPQHDSDTPGNIRYIVETTWYEEPDRRPSSDQIVKLLRKCHNFKKTVIDSIVETTEEYTRELEGKLLHSQQELHDLLGKLKHVERRLVPRGLCGDTVICVENDLDSVRGDCETRAKSLKTSAPIFLLPKIEESIDRRASVVCVKHNIISTEQSGIWTAVCSLDLSIDQLAGKYNAFVSNLHNRVTALICGLDPRDDDHVTSAASLALELVAGGSGEALVQLQGGIDTGIVHTYLVNNSVPKCYFSGETVDTAFALAQESEPSGILVSSAFAQSVGGGKFKRELRIGDNQKNMEKAYWLSASTNLMCRVGGLKNYMGRDGGIGSMVPV